MKSICFIKYSLVVIVLFSSIGLYGADFETKLEKPNQESDSVGLAELHQRTFYVGFIFGLNSTGFNVNTVSDIEQHGFDKITSNFGLGFGLGLVSNFRLNNSFDLRLTPTLSFTEREINYSFVEEEGNQAQELEVTYIEFPLLVRYNFDYGERNNPYVIAGVNYARDLRSTETVKGENILVRTKQNDVLGELGIGLARKMNHLLLGIELKASFGFNNLVTPGEVHDGYHDAIESLRARKFSLSITIE